MGRGLYENRSNLLSTTKVAALVLVVFAVLTDHIQAARVQVQPDRALLNEGQKTELLCRYEKQIHYCRIEIPGEGRVLNLSPSWNKTPGFTYFGSGLEAGECGVTIERVSASQNGKVKCSLGGEGEEYEGTIDLVIALRPQQPVIELLSKPERDDSFAADSLFTARCVVRDGRPAANISWYIDDMPVVQGLSEPNVIDSLSDKNVTLSTTEQRMQKYLTPEDDGKMLICRAHHQTDRDQPQEGKFPLRVRYAPIPQPDATVYGLYLERTAMVNVTIRANPTPITEWTIEGIAIQQGTQHERFSAYEPINIGNGYYNVTLAIAGLTLEDTTKTYYLKASNALGVREYTVRISSSSTPPSSGLEIGSIVGIVVAVAVLVIVILLIGFARVTGRWCFAAKSSKTQSSETSDTESADIKTENKSNAAKSQRLPSFTSLFMRKNEKSKKDSQLAAEQTANATEGEQNADESSRHAADGGRAVAGGSTTGNSNQPEEDKQIVYAELVLKPSDNQPMPAKNSTEYAEIVYVQKPTPGTVTGDSAESKGKI